MFSFLALYHAEWCICMHFDKFIPSECSQVQKHIGFLNISTIFVSRVLTKDFSYCFSMVWLRNWQNMNVQKKCKCNSASDCDKCSFVVGNYMQKQKIYKKSNMVCLLVGSDARVNNIANQTKSSNKIFFNYTVIQFWNFIIK